MIDLSIATNPFLNEERREFWGKIERRIQEEYGAPSLPEYLENELSNQTITSIASKLNVEYWVLYKLTQTIGLKIKMYKKPKKDKRINRIVKLKDLQDIINLDILSLSSLSPRKRENWEPIEQKLIEDGKAPSLPAYLLYKFHFKYKSLRDLGAEFNRSHQTTANMMRSLRIPSRSEVIYIR